MNALDKLFVFSLRKYMQAAKEIATCSKRMGTVNIQVFMHMVEAGRGEADRERQNINNYPLM